jgi:hypothetical protein
MKTFTLYIDNNAVAQQTVIGDADVPCPSGWTDTTGQAVTVAPPVPDEVSAPALFYALSQQPAVKGGANLLADCDAFAASTGGVAQIYWTRSATFRRDSPLLGQVAASFGMTSDRIDSLFRAAAQVAV